MGHRKGHSALHLLGCALVSRFEALHVKTQYRRQLPDGHLLQGAALALAPVQHVEIDIVPAIGLNQS